MVVMTGTANHAGTTPMELRRDAFRELADFVAEVPGTLCQHGAPASRLTVGKVELLPNFSHTVLGRVEFSIVGRDMREAVTSALAAVCRTSLNTATEGHDLALEIREASWLAPTPCHPDIIATFLRQVAVLGIEASVMSSGTGQDTRLLTQLTRSGRIFVVSRNGIRHSPEEHSSWSDIEAGSTCFCTPFWMSPVPKQAAVNPDACGAGLQPLGCGCRVIRPGRLSAAGGTGTKQQQGRACNDMKRQKWQNTPMAR